VLIIDQFEELLTTHPEHWAKKTDFFHQLGQAMKEDPYLHILLAMREDYVAALDPYAPLVPNRMRARFYMERMGVTTALEAIRRPAALGGRPFAPGVAEKLVDNLRQIRIIGQSNTVLGQYVEPVQLQVICYQLWENIKHQIPSQKPSQITDADLQAAGDVDQALVQFYDVTLAAVLADPAAAGISERLLRTWFNEQVITEAGTRGLVYQAERETGGLPNALVSMLQNYFLVRAETRSGNTWVELVHDRFVEPILASNRAWFTLNTSPLQRQADLWQQQGRPEELLLTDNTLADAEQWAETHPNELLTYEREFLSASQYFRDQRKRQTLRLRTLIISAWIISVISIAVAVWALIAC
jgi:hypothetical protein